MTASTEDKKTKRKQERAKKKERAVKPRGERVDGVVPLFIGLMITMLLASLNNTVLSTVMPTMAGELNGVEHLGWLVTAFILATTIVMPVYGSISDVIGRKPAILAAITIFMIGSVVAGMAETFEWMIVARVIQGLGAGGLMILSQAAVADVIPARERGLYMGIMGGVFAFSSVAGPLLGGWMTDGPGWRWVFWINLPLGVLALLAILIFFRTPFAREEQRARVDYLGMMVLALLTTTIVLVATWGGSTYAWNSVEIIALIGASVLLVALFIFIELRVSNPVIPLGMFKNRNFVLTTIATLAIGVAFFGVLGYVPVYLQMVEPIGPSVAGLLMIPMMGALLITSTLIGWVVARTGKYKVYPIIGLLLSGLGIFLLGTITVASPLWLLCVYLAVLGVGLGFSMQLLTLIVQNSFPLSMVGTATASNNYFRQVGATLGSAIVGALFATNLMDMLSARLPNLETSGVSASSLTPEVLHALPEPTHSIIVGAYNEALMPVFLMLVPLTVIGAIVLLFMKEEKLATTVSGKDSSNAAVADSDSVQPSASATTATSQSVPNIAEERVEDRDIVTGVGASEATAGEARAGTS